jgi:hypothetical protein
MAADWFIVGRNGKGSNVNAQFIEKNLKRSRQKLIQQRLWSKCARQTPETLRLAAFYPV